MTETWDQMEARHAMERREMVRRLQVIACQTGARALTGGKLSSKPSMLEINAGVATKHGIEPDEMRGSNRLRAFAHPRQEAFSVARKYGYSFPQIGRFYDRDHTTVLYGVQEHEKRAAQ